jgi:hypothetical protein
MNLSTVLSVAFGALVGSIATIITTLINANREHKRNLVRCATDASIEDFKAATAMAEKTAAKVFPMSTYVFYHIKFLELADRGRLDESSIKTLLQQRDSILELYRNTPAEPNRFFS